MPDTVTTATTTRSAAPRREHAIAAATTAAAVAAMAVDHLVGDDPGLEDPPTFLISVALSFALAGLVFGRVVPRARAAGRSRPHTGVVLGVVAIVPGVATLWLGLPFVLAGGGLALGLAGRGAHDRTRWDTAAVAIATVVLAAASAAYLAQAVVKLT